MQQPASPKEVMLGQLSAQVAVAARRFGRLQEDAAAISTQVMVAREQMQKRYSSQAVIQKSLESEFDELRNDVALLSERLRRLTNAFRYLIKSDTFSALQARIDALPYESFMRRQEFSAALEKAFSSPQP